MSIYQDLTIDVDPDSYVADAYTFLQTAIPGYDPNAGNLETFILQACARIVAELREVAIDVPAAIFRYYGSSIAGIPPIDAVAATAATTWTLTDTLGHTITAGTQVGINDSAGNTQVFVVVSDVVVAPGASTTGAGGVLLVAATAGIAASGLSSVPVVIDPIPWVQSIALVGSTSGGLDAEDDDTYLNRLRTQLQLMAPRPILPNDFAVFGRNVTGVWRMIAIDGYNPAAGGTYNNARTVAVAGMDSAGAILGSTPKAAVLADLTARREANFIVNVIDPTISAIDVTIVGKAAANYSAATVQASVQAAITSFLNPLTWGQPAAGDARDWNLVSNVRYLELAQAINGVTGFDYIQTLQLAIHGNVLGSVDVVLPGVAPLPTATGGTISVTIS